MDGVTASHTGGKPEEWPVKSIRRFDRWLYANFDMLAVSFAVAVALTFAAVAPFVWGR